MRHIPTSLYIDTEFFKRQGLRFDTKAFNALKGTFAKSGLRLLVSTIMKREPLRHFAGEAEKAANAVTNAHKAYPVNTLAIVELPTDEEFLTYLNDWDDEHRDKDNWLVEINIPALAGVFQSLFKEKIVPDGERLAFWLADRDRIARPVYVAAMLKAMLELVKEKNGDGLLTGPPAPLCHAMISGRVQAPAFAPPAPCRAPQGKAR